MSSQLHISVSPHIHSGKATWKIMLDVIIALIPAAIAGTVIFGWRALLIILTCIASAVLSEFVFNLILKREQTIDDLSAVVTGFILALNLPATIPYWQAVVGSVFAIIVVKCLFGGLGKNLVNPAITARVFMLVSFTEMTAASLPDGALADKIFEKFPDLADAVSGATPLPTIVENSAEVSSPSLLTLLFGTYGGAIGETCSVALLIGGIYLIARKVISWHLPVAFIGGTFVISLFFNGFDPMNALALILSGGLLIGAIFMATDYVTSPSTALGKIIFGIGAAFLTVLIRYQASYPEGVSFAILLMNIVTPYIDQLTPRKLFGGKVS